MKGLLALVEQRPQQARPVTEATEQRALANPRSAGHLIHRHATRAPLGHQPLGRTEDRIAVARGVGPLVRFIEQRQSGRRQAAPAACPRLLLNCFRTLVHLCYYTDYTDYGPLMIL